MKKRNFISIILGLFLSILLVMPVHAEDLSIPSLVLPDGGEVQPMDEQTLQQEQQKLIENLPFAFGEFPSFTVSNVDAWSFQSANYDGFLGGTQYGGPYGRYWSSGHYVFVGPIENIPTGAVVFGMQMEACDFVNDGQIEMSFSSSEPLVGGWPAFEKIYTGTAATPGCQIFNAVVDPPVLIWNMGKTYRFIASFTKASADLHFSVVKLAWSRVISPAPANATFNDVGKSHWAFQSVEALAASGITKGCPDGPNLFCPDKPVSRAAMAAFLARALGLHWPG